MSVNIVPIEDKWRAYCKECDKYVSDSTADIQYAEKKGLVHLASTHIDHSSVEILK
jgi:hypothetical protein